MTPFIEVSHLPSSASFYAAITQPVGIKYLSAGPDHSLNFGIPQVGSLSELIFFNLRPSPSPAIAQVTFTASSAEAVTGFHKSALQAGDSNATISQTPDQFVAETQDMDGNLLRVEYSRSPPRRSSAPTVYTTTSSKEAKRVLDWQYEVAASNSDADSVISQAQQPRVPTVVSRAPSLLSRAQTVDEQPTRVVQRQTITTTSQPADSNEGGISTKAIFGTLLAAAAGAAVGYAMTRGENQDDSDAPVRRASFEIERTFSAVPRSERGMGGPDYMAHYSKAPSNAQHELAQIDEEPRPYITRSQTMPAGSTASRHSASIAPSKAETKASRHSKLALMPPPSYVSTKSKHGDEGRSQAGSRHDDDTKSEAKKSHRSKSHASYSTAKTSHSDAHSNASTLKPASKASKAPRAESSHSTTTVTAKQQDRKSTISAREIRLPASSVGSVRYIPLPESEVSARQVPLPVSRACSVAPSESISNVGSRRSGRSRA